MKKINSAALISLILMLLFPVGVYANSSWHWITQRRPWYVLPFAAVLTVVIEIIMIKKAAGIQNNAVFRLCSAVIIGNLLSFALPYIWYLETAVDEGIYTFEHFMETWPAYTVGLVFLAMTLIIETPAVYFTMRKKAKSGKKLILAIIVSNTVTTLMTAGAERLISPGRW